jgi:RNA polymerase sigma-70 factor (ECF subfamily)
MDAPSPTNFATQIEEHLPSLMRRAHHLCQSRADAEDLVQDTILRAMTHCEQFVPGTHLRAWLMQILYHAFVSGHRSRKRQRLAFERYALEPQSNTYDFTVECATELPERIQRALGVLPENIAEVVKLVDIDELSYREAAESLNVPVGTVMSRLFRGRQRLAVQLSESSYALARNQVAA